MKKTLCITLSLLFTLALSACGKADSPVPEVPGSNPSNTPVVSVPNAGSQQGPGMEPGRITLRKASPLWPPRV